MGAIRALARNRFRRRWRALALLGVLTGLIGGAALSTAAMARRTSTAYERLREVTRSEDMMALALGPGIAEQVLTVDGIASSWISDVVVGRVVQDEGVNFLAVAAGPPPPPDLFAPIPTQGRMFHDDDAHEVVLTEIFAEFSDVTIGDTIELDLLTTDQFEDFGTGIDAGDGPEVSLTVVGLVRYPADPDAMGGVIASPAFRERYITEAVDAGGIVFMRIEGGRAAAPAFEQRLIALGKSLGDSSQNETLLPFDVVDPGDDARAVAGTARVLVLGLAVFAVIASVAGGFVLVQISIRRHAAEAEDQSAERALGLTGAQRVAARLAPTLVSAAIGAAIASAATILLSRLAPLGVVARHEPSPGTEVNLAILLAGSAIIVVVVLAIDGIAAARAGRPGRVIGRAHPSWLAERLATIGARPPLVVGLRFSFEPGRGGRAVPVRSVLAGAIIGIAGLIAVASFGDNLTLLTTESKRFGFDGDFLIVDLKLRDRHRLVNDTRVGSVSVYSSSAVRLADDRVVPAYGIEQLKGSGGWTMLDGRAPSGPLEVAIGSRLARHAGHAVGDLLEVGEPAGGMRSLTIVGIGMGPVLSNEPFGDNLLLAPPALAALRITEPTTEAVVAVLDTSRREDVIADHRTDTELFEASPPTEVDNLRQLGSLPLLLAILLGAFGVAALVNGLVVGVRRRRADLAILRTIGFSGGQIRSAIRLNGLAIAITSLAIGLPLGIALGKVAWRAVASTAYVSTDSRLPVLFLAVVIPSSIAIALVIATVPGLRAARAHPAAALRAE